MQTIYIYDLGGGWYDFKNVPQGYIKVHGKLCKSQDEAIKYAAGLYPDAYYEIVHTSLEAA